MNYLHKIPKVFYRSIAFLIINFIVQYQSAKQELERAKRNYRSDGEDWQKLVIICEDVFETLYESWGVLLKGKAQTEKDQLV